jgi:ribA/ribD-fused uncharacterized protein
MNICSQQDQCKIDSFSGIFHFLSNFHRAPLMYHGIAYPTSEHAYQAAKTLNENSKMNISILGTPSEAKRYGQTVSKRIDWAEVKLEIMAEIVRAKFIQNPTLREKLLATDDAILEEGNTWGDTYWGVCKGSGENNLGKVLMELRDCLNTNTEE